MQDINMVVLTGGLTKDATVRNTQNGAFYSFSIGFNKSIKDASGDWSDKSLYRDCSYFSKSNYWAQALKKGTKVCIKGQLDTSEYLDTEGAKRKKDFIRVEELQVFTKKADQKPAQVPVQDNYVDDNFDYDSPVF